jgi:hypothetical protein
MMRFKGKTDLISLVVLLFVYYLVVSTIRNTYFFPSSAWDAASYVLSIVLSTFLTIFLTVRAARNHFISRSNPAAKPTKLKVVVGICLCWFLFVMTFRLGLGLGAARIWTEWTGQPWSQFVSAEKTNKVNTGGRRSFQPKLYCLSTPELRQGEYSRLCIPLEQFKSLPQNFSMRVEGKQSWFGFVIEQYSLPEPKKLLEPEKM